MVAARTIVAARMTRLLPNLLLLAVALCLSIAGGELLSRSVFPVKPQGEIVEVTRTADGGRVLHVVADEYEKRYGETAAGYRAPAVEDPEVVFIGDSFTYGIGLDDEESIPFLYCRERGLRCANLGVSGSGTGYQVARLRRFLEDRGWRPERVKLLMLAMVGYFGAGNDLLDNLDYAESQRRLALAGERKASEKALDLGRIVLGHSNLARIVYFHTAPTLRAWLSMEPESRRLKSALEITRGFLQELDAMSRHYGFDYEIYTVHPMQDIANGTFRDTVRALSRIAPAGQVVSTRPAFRGNVEDYYYRYDGHFSPKGSRAVAAFLAARAAGRPLR